MREMSIYLSGAVLGISFLGIVTGIFEDGFWELYQVILAPIMMLGIIAGSAASCWYMWNAYTAPKNIWWIALAIGAVTFVLGWWAMTADYSFTAVSVIMLAGIVIPFTASFKLVDDNPYRVQSGQVVAQDFTPEHTNLSCVNSVCTATTVADDWALKLHNCKDFKVCRSGWIHFDSNVFKQYPVGSNYPRE